ncbi:sporozoite surface protein 2-like isoform X2 [Diabrotica virgifera virgifera]|uniref:Sporozoite surface protein 2-like n=1 Tax=Diabrotica virgifera virgifera TaxID=50390 RepID=A0ABM5JTV3_DIAVI|nr:sporozoite surface protein 2-like isoform X2 [Diabrotica virgifera virgifera]
MWARSVCAVLYLFFVLYEVNSLTQQEVVQQINKWKKEVDEFNCNMYKWQKKMFPNGQHTGPDPCSSLQGQVGELPKGFDPHVELASIKPPDILTNGNVPVNKVTLSPNNSDKNKTGQLFPNNPFLNNGQVQNTNGVGSNIGSGIPNTQNPNGQVQPFNPYINGWNFPNNGFNPSGQWNPNTGYPNYQFNPAGQYPYPGPYNPNPNQFYPNGQPVWGNNGNFPNQGTFPNANQPNTGQSSNWPYNPNPYPGQINNGQYPNVNGVPNWMPNQNTNQNPGHNQGQFPNPWGFNPNPNQDQNGQKPNQGTNINLNTNQGSGQTNQLPNNNPKQGQYPNQNGQPIWGNQNPNQGTGQNGQFPNINNQPVRGNVSPNENDSKNTGIVFPGPDSQGPGGRSILNSNNSTHVTPTLLSTTSTTTPTPSTTITTPTPGATSSTPEILITIASTTSTTSKPNCHRLTHSEKRELLDDDIDKEEFKKKFNLPICDETTDRPETTVTVQDPKSIINGVRSNCPEGYLADKSGDCREQY